MNRCRISFTDLVPADDSTFQIRESSMLHPHMPAKNVYVSETDDEIEDHLYRIMEKYDSLDHFHIFTENLSRIERFLFFLRDQNPRKEIRVCVLSDTLSPESEGPVADIIDSLRYVKGRHFAMNCQ